MINAFKMYYWRVDFLLLLVYVINDCPSIISLSSMWVDCWWLSWVMFTCIIWSSGGSVESMISGCKSKWSKQIELRAKQSRLSESNQRWGKKWRRNFFFCHTDQVTPSWRTIPNRWSCRITKSVVIPSPLLQPVTTAPYCSKQVPAFRWHHRGVPVTTNRSGHSIAIVDYSANKYQPSMPNNIVPI